MYPRVHAEKQPDKVAALMADTGERLTYGELDERSTRLARVFRDAGLRRGDVVALLTSNDLQTFVVMWAAYRSGLYLTAVNKMLAPGEVAHIIRDSGAKALVISADLAELASAVADPAQVAVRLAYGGPVPGFSSFEDAVGAASAEPLLEEPAGTPMLYSSGTTGVPKGVRPPLPDAPISAGPDPLLSLAKVFEIDEDTVLLSPAPLYHAAPLRWCYAVQAWGGTVVLMARFDAEGALRAIEDHEVTHGQFVPTMFVRMLDLDEQTRAGYDLSSLSVAMHAAAPCPVHVKRKMLDWWGPILVEYYGGTEVNGLTIINSERWLQKPGSVGTAALGVLHICDDEGNELAPGEIGTVYFERDHLPFTYHNDEEKTRAAQHPEHPTWTAIGDVGYVDEDGFLFLTDRKAFTIISGGVNIYPAEVENVLTQHESVGDVAVLGVPDDEMGESVLAFVKLARGVTAGEELAPEIIEFARARIAHFKVPRRIEFVEELPYTETGKLLKRDLRDRYLARRGRDERHSRRIGGDESVALTPRTPSCQLRRFAPPPGTGT